MAAKHERLSPLQRAPEILWMPLVTVLVLLVPASIGLAAGRIMLFPSLASSALLQAHRPEDASSRAWNVAVAHLVGIGAAFLAVTILGIAHMPSVFEIGHLTLERVAAALLALLIAAVLEIALDASHPPAASTTLLITLGSFKPTTWDVTSLLLGVLCITLVGEFFRRLRARPRG